MELYTKVVNLGTNHKEPEFNPDSFSKPAGIYKREVVLQTNGRRIDGSKYDITFDVPFDDDLQANEAEFVVYNLNQSTINCLYVNSQVTLTAGYKGNTGIIFQGFISLVNTERDGVDKKTTIKAIDSMKLKERKIATKSYASGCSAGQILKDLIALTGLPLAIFKPRKNPTFAKAITVEGELFANIKKYAEMCGVSAYISKGKAYVRSAKDGDNVSYTIDSNSGMVGSPEAFEEEIQDGDTKTVVRGLNLKILLNPKIETASIVRVDSEEHKGSYRVRSGKHTGGDTDFYTELEAIQ